MDGRCRVDRFDKGGVLFRESGAAHHRSRRGKFGEHGRKHGLPVGGDVGQKTFLPPARNVGENAAAFMFPFDLALGAFEINLRFPYFAAGVGGAEPKGNAIG